MTEANKKTVKTLGIVAAVLAGYIAFVHLVPDDSFLKVILGVIMVIALIAGTLMFTSLGNPLKRLYRKWKENKGK